MDKCWSRLGSSIKSDEIQICYIFLTLLYDQFGFNFQDFHGLSKMPWGAFKHVQGREVDLAKPELISEMFLICFLNLDSEFELVIHFREILLFHGCWD